MAQLNPTPIHVTSAFHISGNKRIVVEHSDIGNCNIAAQLYDDACDVGIVLYNPFTGRTTRWYLQQEVKDQEGELQVTVFKPTSETLHKHPANEGWELHILND